MTLAESIEYVTEMLGRGEKSPSEERQYRIELQALQDVYWGHPYNEERWNLTERYVYAAAWDRAQTELRCEGRGRLPYDRTMEEPR